MHGEDDLALENKDLTLFSLSPTYLLSNSGPLTAIKLALLAFATALANRVLPHPGGPYSKTPAGELILNFSNVSGSTMGKIILLYKSSFKLLRPPISSHETSGIEVNPSLLPVGYTYFKAN